MFFRPSASLLVAGLALVAKTSVQADESMSEECDRVADPDVHEIPGAIDPDDLGITGGDSVDIPMDGGWMRIDVTDVEVALLAQISANASWNVQDENTPAVCVLEVQTLEMQTVDGYMYNFGVQGCAVGSKEELGECQDANCTAAGYQVEVYAPYWKEEMEVVAVTLLG